MYTVFWTIWYFEASRILANRVLPFLLVAAVGVVVVGVGVVQNITDNHHSNLDPSKIDWKFGLVPSTRFGSSTIEGRGPQQ